MQKNILETLMGAVVLLVAGAFLTFAYKGSEMRVEDGYAVEARFSNISGIFDRGKIDDEVWEELEELLIGSDLISLHCPSTAKTRGLINRDTLNRMKRGALLVNTSRGDLIVTDDLVAALKSGQLGGAALDVTNPEPIPKDSPLLALDKRNS